MKVTDPQTKETPTLSFHPEIFRLMFFLLFWLMSGIGILLTYVFNVGYISHNPILMAFGINSLCIFFDSSPAFFVMPTIWFFCGLTLVIYSLACALRGYEMYRGSMIGKKTYIAQLILYTATIIVVGYFSTVFAVHPNQNIFLHTLPFMMLIFSLSIINWNTFFIYKDIGMPNYLAKYLIFYNIAQSLVSVYYGYAIANVIFNLNGPHIYYATVVDRSWLILLAVVPIFNAILLLKNTCCKVTLTAKFFY
jgi:hypothetical protein